MSVSSARVLTPHSLPQRDHRLGQLRASSRVGMNAAQPNFTSSTSASRLSASFFERMEATMSGMEGTVPVTSRRA